MGHAVLVPVQPRCSAWVTRRSRNRPQSTLHNSKSVGRIGAEPASPQTPKNGQCAGVRGNVVSNVVFQRAKTGGLAWGSF
jgi:hypothetical protein